MDCQNCGYEVQVDWNLCPNCGVQLKEEITERITCKNCGGEIKGAWEKCHHCGVQLKGSKKIDFTEAKNLFRKLKDKLNELVPAKLTVEFNKYYVIGVIIVLVIIIISSGAVLISSQADENLWQKVYSSERSSFMSIKPTNSGYLLGGAAGSDSYLISIDERGSKQWSKKQKNWGSIIDIIKRDDGYLIGFESGIISYINDKGQQSIIHDLKREIMSMAVYQGQTIVLSKDFKLIKFNKNWETEWIKNVPFRLEQDLHMRINNLHYTANGNILLVFDQQVYKLTTTGKIIWEQGFDHHLYTIKEDNDGGILLAGTDAAYDNASLIKLDSQGQELWRRDYDHAQESIFDIALNSDGYLLVGATLSETSDSDGYTIKVDQQGRVEWTKQYGGAGSEIFATVKETNKHGYLVVGISNSFGAVGQTAYAVKINHKGEIMPQK